MIKNENNLKEPEIKTPILLIDDDQDSLESLAEVLGNFNYECESFTSPMKATFAFGSERFNIVITDYKMLGMNGLDVLRTFLDMDPTVKVIIVSGYADLKIVNTCMDEGANSFFSKPLDMKALLMTLKRIRQEINSLTAREANPVGPDEY